MAISVKDYQSAIKASYSNDSVVLEGLEKLLEGIDGKGILWMSPGG